ncbi:PRD domain-containing protein [Erysipelothrix sp. HDW6C]|uniref:BglG family transcription antiterminator n=1 Tax=Erysipelothrix sp. HDW6C TaxID=2714930 RepID=UPI0014099F91|nr:PRD domain-containing protein [Erysipelothrix sp. HDW6C]QIK70258.1 PRD domain-containing protein [Erysipelothrix sp. HDW6C]
MGDIHMESLMTLFMLLHEGKIVDIAAMIESVGASERKVRALLGELRTMGERNGFEIRTIPKAGYLLKATDDALLESFIARNGQMHVDASNRTMRLHNMMLYLINIEEDYSSIDELAELLDVTRPTVVADLKLIVDILEKYELTYVSKPYYGIRIEGIEYNKRNLLADIFTEGIGNFSSMRYFTVDEEEQIKRIVFNGFYENQLYFNEAIFNETVAHVEVFIMRIFNADVHIRVDVNRMQIDAPSLNAANYIMTELMAKFGLPLSPKEEMLLALNIFVMTNSYQLPVEIQEKYVAHVKSALNAIDGEYHTNYSMNASLVNRLTYHVYALLIRISYKYEFKNPNYDRIGLKHIFANLLTIDFIKHLPLLKLEDLSRDELSLLSLHFAATMNDDKYRFQMNVKHVLLATGLIECNPDFLGSRVRMIFPNATLTTRFMKQVDGLDLDAFDLILLTTQHGYIERKTKTLVYELSPIPTDVELQRLQREVIYHNIRRHHGQINRLQEVLLPELFFIETDASLSYQDIVLKYAGIMESKGYAREGFRESVAQRESIGSTLYVSGVGGAHAMDSFTVENSVAVVRVANGRQSKDDGKLIFIFNIMREYFSVYQEVAELYTSILISPKILEISSYDELIIYINEVI